MSRPRDALAASHGPGVTFFLGTVGPDATPHAAGIGAVWKNDTLWFVSGPRTRKSRNLATNRACTISCRLPGIDVVLEGRAERVTDAATIARLPNLALAESALHAPLPGFASTSSTPIASTSPPYYSSGSHATIRSQTATSARRG